MSLNVNQNQLHNIKNPLKSRFQEQIAKYLTADNSVFQYSNANDMRVTQDLNSFGEIIAHAQCSADEKKNIFRVYHIRIIAKTNWFTRHETDRFLNNHCQECVRAYLSIHDCLSFLHEVMIGHYLTKTFLLEVLIGNHQNKTTES